MIQRISSSHHHSQGAVLLVALVLLLAMTIIGVAAIDTTTMESQMSRNTQEANTRYQITVNEIEKRLRLTALSSDRLTNIIKSTTTISSSSNIGISHDGPGIALVDADMYTSDGTDPGSDNYTQTGNEVFLGYDTGAHHGYSLGKTRQAQIEFNIISTLNGTRSRTNHTQSAFFPAPPAS